MRERNLQVEFKKSNQEDTNTLVKALIVKLHASTEVKFELKVVPSPKQTEEKVEYYQYSEEHQGNIRAETPRASIGGSEKNGTNNPINQIPVKIDTSVLSQLGEFTKEFGELLNLDVSANGYNKKVDYVRALLAIVRRRLFIAQSGFDPKNPSDYSKEATRLVNLLDELMYSSFEPSLQIFVENDKTEVKTTNSVEKVSVPLLPKYFDPDNFIEYCRPSDPESESKEIVSAPILTNIVANTLVESEPIAPALAVVSPFPEHDKESKELKQSFLSQEKERFKEILGEGVEVFAENFDFFMAALNPKNQVFQQWAATLDDKNQNHLKGISDPLKEAIVANSPLKSRIDFKGIIQFIHDGLKSSLEEKKAEKIVDILILVLPQFTSCLFDKKDHISYLNKLWLNYSTTNNSNIIAELKKHKEFYNRLFDYIDNDTKKIKDICNRKALLRSAISRVVNTPANLLLNEKKSSVLFLNHGDLSIQNHSLINDLNFITKDPVIQDIKERLESHKSLRNYLTVGIIVALIATTAVFTLGFSLLSLPFVLPAASFLLGLGGLIYEEETFSIKDKSLPKDDSPKQIIANPTSYKKMNNKIPVKPPQPREIRENKPSANLATENNKNGVVKAIVEEPKIPEVTTPSVGIKP